VGLGDLAGGIFASSALGVSANGLVVVGESESTSGTQAFRWTSGGGIVGLGDLPGGGKRLNASQAFVVSGTPTTFFSFGGLRA